MSNSQSGIWTDFGREKQSVIVETVEISSLEMILWRNNKCFKGAAVF